MIGGVCAGIAESASIDTLLVRVTAIALCFVTFGLAFLITTVVIVVATLAEEGRSFVSFLPLYCIPAGVFFLVSPSARRTIPIRICIFLLFCEACCVALPFTVGLYDFRIFFVQAPTFFVWVAALALLSAAIIFENTTCYVGAILLILVASIITFYEFGVLTLPSYVTFENFKSFIALGLL